MARRLAGTSCSVRSAASARARTEASHSPAWAVTTPRRWKSSHRLAWNRLRRMPSPGASTQGASFGDPLGQLPELLPVEGEEGPRRKDQVRLALGQGHEQFGEGHLLVAQGHRRWSGRTSRCRLIPSRPGSPPVRPRTPGSRAPRRSARSRRPRWPRASAPGRRRIGPR